VIFWSENEVRKDFTPSERVAIAEAVAAELGERRGGDRRSDDFQSAKSCGLKVEETRDIAAKKAGFGNAETMRQAKAVAFERFMRESPATESRCPSPAPH
jgi:ParB family chromosome partitioning protein